MIGSIANAAAILAGGIAGLLSRSKGLKPAQEAYLKIVLSVFTVFYGLRLTWTSLSGSFGRVLLQLLVVIISMAAGKFLGNALGLQRISNAVGRQAREKMALAQGSSWAGFEIAAPLFCAAPLAWLGAVAEGLANYPAPLLIKAVIEGLASLGFAALFGWTVLLAFIPVLALQGSITLGCSIWILPFLNARALTWSANAVCGLLIFCVALVLLDLKKVKISDYLPALVVAPLLATLIR
jgi:uncharacterized protein